MKNNPLKKQLTAQFYRGNIPILSLAVFGMLVAGGLNLLLSWAIQQLIDAVSGIPGALTIGQLTVISGGLVLLCVAAYLLTYASEPRFIRRAMRQYKEFAFRKLTEKSISSFRDENTADYLSALTNDANSIEADYLSQLLSIISKAVTFFGAIALMLWYSPLMTAIAVGVTLLPLVASLLTGGRIAAAERLVSEKNRDFTSALSDCLGGFAVVKTFKAEKEVFRLFSESNRELEGEKFSRRRLKVIVGMIGSVAGILAQFGVFLIGAYLALAGKGLTPGIVIAFVNLMNFMIDPMASLPGLLAGRKAARGLIDKLAAALKKNPAPTGSKTLARLNKGIRLEHLSFGYEENKDVLHDLSATFEAGKAYAVVGSSGCGKSTLLNLLMASSDAYSGRILFDETELRSITPESVYELISPIQQNVFVFNASVRDNVTMFRDFPRREIEDAINHAHLGGLLAERGEEYLCGENGKGLSGGEKQRIAIARSLLKKSSVLFADEATAALDAETAYQVTNDILDLEGVTRIVVTHTLTEPLLRRYDGILVLKDGRIEESGSFDELMAKRGYFHALFTVAQ